MKKTTFLFLAVLIGLRGHASHDSATTGNPAIIVLCEVPQNVVAANITANGVQLTWTAPSESDEIQLYQYSITTTQTPDIGPTVPGTSAVSQIPLLPATTYYAYVRSFCSGAWSDWSAPVVFTTLCATQNLPYLEDFESAAAPQVPGCTAVETPGAGNSWAVAENPGNGFDSNALTYTAGPEAADSWFFTKAFNLETGVFYKVSFKYGNDSGATAENLSATLSTSQDISGLLGAEPYFSTITDITGGAPQNFSAGPFMVPFSDTFHLAFQVYSAAGQGSLSVDDILIERWTCGAPVDPSVTDITANSATLSWEAAAGNIAQVYSYVVTTDETPPADGGTFSPNLVNQLADLESETTYYVHVRAICSGVWSDWSTVSFTTPALGTQEFAFGSLVVYPNPFSDRLFISNDKAIDRVSLYTLLGQRIATQEFHGQDQSLDLSKIEKGYYLMTVVSGSSSKTVGVVKK